MSQTPATNDTVAPAKSRRKKSQVDAAEEKKPVRRSPKKTEGDVQEQDDASAKKRSSVSKASSEPKKTSRRSSARTKAADPDKSQADGPEQSPAVQGSLLNDMPPSMAASPAEEKKTRRRSPRKTPAKTQETEASEAKQPEEPISSPETKRKPRSSRSGKSSAAKADRSGNDASPGNGVKTSSAEGSVSDQQSLNEIDGNVALQNTVPSSAIHDQAQGHAGGMQEQDHIPAVAEAFNAWQDEGNVTNILPYPGEAREDVRGMKRRRTRRSANGQASFNASYLPAAYQQDAYGQQSLSFERQPIGKRKWPERKPRRPRSGVGYSPEGEFTQAMLNDSILGTAQTQHAAADYIIPEDDGPQPALPNQPIAKPMGVDDLPEDALEALDAAVNGNRISPPFDHFARESRPSKRGRKALRDLRPQKPEHIEEAFQEKAAAAKKVRRVLYISVVPGEQVEVVITEDGQVTEYFVEMAHQVKIRGNIYKGVINNIDTNLQAAFVNFGNGKNGFLQIDEVHPEYYLVPHDETGGAKYPLIQKALKVGQELLVQVVKEPSGSKGAFLTTWISIAGRFLVLTPGQEQIGVSRKVTDNAERSRLKELLAGIQPGENMGVIIRTASEGASKESIQQDLQFLKKLYEEIKEKAGREKSPSLIYQEADLAARSVRDYLSDSIAEIWTDDEATQKRLEETVGLIFPGKDIVKLHKDVRQGMWEHFNILKQLDSVTSREVLLPSGGRLVFDQTEALMAIDINSGKTQGKTNFESMVFRTNMEAAEAIARHLRLRDIGGQVVIDFIEMRDKNHCLEVERTLRNAMRRDKACHDIGHMSSFGLLELVRQRTGTSAISISTEPCPHCHGTGLRRNMEWQSLHALRDMEIRIGKMKDGAKGKKQDQRSHENTVFNYECDAELAMYVLNRKRDRIIALEEKFGTRIEIKIK